MNGFTEVLRALWRQRAGAAGTDLPKAEAFAYRSANAPPRYVVGILERDTAPVQVRTFAIPPLGILPGTIDLQDDRLELTLSGRMTRFKIARVVAQESNQLVLELS
jgi:hypothetical protein